MAAEQAGLCRPLTYSINVAVRPNGATAPAAAAGDSCGANDVPSMLADSAGVAATRSRMVGAMSAIEVTAALKT